MLCPADKDLQHFSGSFQRDQRNFAYEKQAGVEAHSQATGREIPFRHRDSTGQCCEVPGGNVESR